MRRPRTRGGSRSRGRPSLRPARPALQRSARTADEVRPRLGLDLDGVRVHNGAPRTPQRGHGPAAPERRPLSEDASPLVHDTLGRSPGEALDGGTRAFLEPRFGIDLSGVRIHADRPAAESARALRAHAYTVGRDIFFGAGRYAPSSTEGRRLLAHEITHAVQQSRGGGAQASRLAVQRADIDHRALTWDDFQGPVPRGARSEAGTSSGFRALDIQAVLPSDPQAIDTGQECPLEGARGKKGEKGHKFRVDTTIEKAKLNVEPFMSQEQSWRSPWTTDPAAREARCRTRFVRPCDDSFAQGLAQIERSCRGAEKDCQKAFKGGDTASYYGEYGGQKITVKKSEDCTRELLERCRTLLAKDLRFEAELWGTQLKATTRDECTGSNLRTCTDGILERESSRLLRHEQGHFDITKVLAGKTQAALRQLAGGFDQEVGVCAGASDKAQIKAAETAARQKAEAALHKAAAQLKKGLLAGEQVRRAKQGQYDSATDHGVVSDEQAAWEKAIKKGLP